MSRSLYYFETLVKTKSSADWLAWGLFPNAKEITESLGCFEAVAQNIDEDFNNDKVNLVVIGDGSTPRTAAVFATRTKWNCYSVDPEMRDRPWDSMIGRLKTFKSKIQDVPLDLNGPTILVFPHSHVKINDAIKNLKVNGPLHIMAMPCCLPLYLKGFPHHIEYNDNMIWSEKNLIKIWKNLSLQEIKEKKHEINPKSKKVSKAVD
jgi:hypothetical protein